jgi:uncharacterized tellurite resistance protein B-like protein
MEAGTDNTMMIDRLLAELGRPAEKAAAAQAQLQLATTILVYSVLPADYVIHRTEVSSLISELKMLFNLPRSNANRLISRAAVAQQSESAILACATLLKLKTDVSFRQNVFAAAIRVSLADGTNHQFEIHLVERLARLLNVSPAGQRRAA